MIKFQENTQTDARREGWADPHRIFLATTRRLTTAVDWHLKVKNKSYCITDSMQKISSIHKLIQQILGSHELNDHIHFWPAHPKTTEITFSFPEFALACKKSVHSINSFLPYSQSYNPVTRLATPISDHVHPNIFWSTFNLCEYVSTCKKSGYFIDLFWRHGWLKIPGIWLAKNILAHISGTRILRFVQEQSK